MFKCACAGFVCSQDPERGCRGDGDTQRGIIDLEAERNPCITQKSRGEFGLVPPRILCAGSLTFFTAYRLAVFLGSLCVLFTWASKPALGQPVSWNFVWK